MPVEDPAPPVDVLLTLDRPPSPTGFASLLLDASADADENDGTENDTTFGRFVDPAAVVVVLVVVAGLAGVEPIVLAVVVAVEVGVPKKLGLESAAVVDVVVVVVVVAG